MYLECRFRSAKTLAIRVTGRDAGQISRDEDNLIWQTAVRIAKDVGQDEAKERRRRGSTGEAACFDLGEARSNSVHLFYRRTGLQK